MALIKQAITNSTFNIDVETYYYIRLSDGVYHMNNILAEFMGNHYFRDSARYTNTTFNEYIFGEVEFSELDSLKNSINPLLIRTSQRTGTFLYVKDEKIAAFIIENFTKIEITSLSRIKNRRSREVGDLANSKQLIKKAEKLKIRTIENSLDFESSSPRFRSLYSNLPSKYKMNDYQDGSDFLFDSPVLVGIETVSYSTFPTLKSNRVLVKSSQSLDECFMDYIKQVLTDSRKEYRYAIKEYLTKYPVDKKLEEHLNKLGVPVESIKSSYYLESLDLFNYQGSLFLFSIKKHNSITIKYISGKFYLALPYNIPSKPNKWVLLPEVVALA